MDDLKATIHIVGESCSSLLHQYITGEYSTRHTIDQHSNSKLVKIGFWKEVNLEIDARTRPIEKPFGKTMAINYIILM